MSEDVWTDTTYEKLKVLYGKGWSHAQIGKTLGLTRNQVMSKIHRNRKDFPARDGAVAIPKNVPPRTDPKTFEIEGAMAPGSSPRLWTERKFSECAFPVDGDGADIRSCCDDTGGETYCAYHFGMMYKPSNLSTRDLMRLVR